jgi:transposase
MLLFSDETGFCLHPKLGRVWAKKGSQPFVLTKSEHRKRLNIFGWVDQARWHKGYRVAEFLSQHRRLAISYIPKYHPELNPQEILWHTMRYEETTNTYYENEEEMSLSIFTRSQSWRPQKILSLCHLI